MNDNCENLNKQTTSNVDKDGILSQQTEEKKSELLVNSDVGGNFGSSCGCASPIKSSPQTQIVDLDNPVKKKLWYKCGHAVAHYITLIMLLLLLWGFFWSAWGANWAWAGHWFRLAFIAFIGWVGGLILEKLTTLPPPLAALITGILARHLGFIDIRQFPQIDSFFRRIYPVIILGKVSLSWNVEFLKENWRQVLPLATLPWATEVILVAVFSHFILDFPWIWGFLLGTAFACLACPVVMPAITKHRKTATGPVNWTPLICTSARFDVTLSVGVFGVIFTFMFYETNDTYRIVKAALALFVGVAAGMTWGTLVNFFPTSKDYYVTELRVLLLLFGGLFANFFASSVGWGGTGVVAVLACNVTAATHWSRKGWDPNDNPAGTVYRVLWTICEPMLYSFTGTYFAIDSSMGETMLIGFGMLLLSLTVRLIVAALACYKLTLKQRLFICCCWIPKLIVEAILCPMAINAITMTGIRGDELHYAEELMRLLVLAMLITTPVSFLLVNNLGPFLLSANSKSKTEPARR